MASNAQHTGRSGDRPSVFPRPVLPMGYPVLGRCVLERFVRHGTLASVYLARETLSTGARFGVRMLDPEHARRPGYSTTAFMEEMERLKGLRHRAIPGVVAYDPGPLEPVILTRHEGGTTLRRLMADKKQPTGSELGRVITEIASALKTMHRATPPVLHRALCPENIRLAGQGGPVWVEECGLVHVAVASGMASDQREFTLPGYLPPEGLLRDPGPKTDALTLAIIAFECLTGRLPFDSQNPEGTTEGESSTAPVYADLSSDVEAVFTRMWSVPEDEAYKTPQAFAADLAYALREHPRMGAGGAKATLPGMAPVSVPVAVSTPQGTRETPDPGIARIVPARDVGGTQELSVDDLLPVESEGASGSPAGTSPPPLPSSRTPTGQGPRYDLEVPSYAPPPVVEHPLGFREEPTMLEGANLTASLEDAWEPPPPRQPRATREPDPPAEALAPPKLPDLVPEREPSPPESAESAPQPDPAPVAKPAPASAPRPDAKPAPAPSPSAPSGTAAKAQEPALSTPLLALVTRVLVPSTVLSAVLATGALLYAAQSLERWADEARALAERQPPRALPPLPTPIAVPPEPPLPTPSPVADAASAAPTGDASGPAPVVSPSVDASTAALADASAQPPTAAADASAQGGPSEPVATTETETDAGAREAGDAGGGTHPTYADQRRVTGLIRTAVLSCVEGVDERTLVFSVRYDGPSGRPTNVRLRGVFSEPPISPCVEEAVRAVRMPTFTEPFWWVRYSFPIPSPQWRPDRT